MAIEALVVAAASRPHREERVNGDAWHVDRYDGTYRIAVIDGLGHGPAAADAAADATTALAAHPTLLPREALQVCHAALHGTRGAAISIAHVDLERARLTYAGVGNVEARLWQSSGCQHPISYRGIVGITLPTVREFDFALEPEWLLVLHTDGVSARFRIEHGPGDETPQQLADALLARWGRVNDDATVVVAYAGNARPDLSRVCR